MAKLEFSAGGVAILGVGREGKATRKYLRSLYPDIRLTLVTETAPGPEFERQLTEYDRLLTGPLSAAGLDNFDLLVRSPGISPYRNSVKAARAAGVAITTPSNLWFESHADQNTICVTGTKGKSTTSALLAHLLRFCGHNVRLAGNIGLPLLDCDDHAVDWWVIELSSYQLADLDARPTLSVILNLSAEHLDWHQSERAYRSDKLRLAELTADRPLIANADDPVLRASLRKRSNITWFNSASGFRVDGNALFDGVKQLPVTLPEGLPGAHNLANAAAALTVLRAIEVNMDNAIEGISSFRCLPHRLQLIGEKDGVRYVNDSISSTPVAMAAALETYSGQAVTLIVGGLDRGLDWTPYMDTVRCRLPEAIIGIPDIGARILDTLRQTGIRPVNGLHESSGLAPAVRLAQKITKSGGVILLSPGAPSFPQFRDYRERGEQFAELCGFVPEDIESFQTNK